MRIDLAEHADLVRGTVEIEETPEGVRCRRMTEEAIEFFREPDRFYRRAQYNNGVRIALVTDSAYLTLHLTQGVTEVPHAYRVDVLVDRAECHTFEPSEPTDDFCFTLELPDGGDHEVEILLPISTEVLIHDLELADGSLFRPLYCSDERLLVLGDSIPAGCAASSPLRAYTARLALELGTDYINWSVGGAQLQSGLARMAMTLEWQKALVAYGTNDFNCNRSAAECREEMTLFLKYLTRRPGVTIYLLTPIVWPDNEKRRNEAGCTLDDIRAALSEAAAAFPQVRVIDGRKLLSDKAANFAEDGLHPSDEGMAILAENLYLAISKLR